MTFEAAFNDLTGRNFHVMRADLKSPLHVKPVLGTAGHFVGYRHVGEYHSETGAGHRYPKWIEDVASPSAIDRYLTFHPEDGSYRMTHPTNRHDAFDRDCCFLCQNVFFATNRGIALDESIYEMLRRAQPDKPSRSIADVAAFGLQSNGDPDGRRGSGLTITDPIMTAALLAYIARYRTAQAGHQAASQPRPRSCC